MRTILATLFAAVIAFAVFTAEAGPYIELGVGKHGLRQSDWRGSYELGGWVAVGMAWDLGDGYTLDAGWYHSSHPFLEPDEEDSLDSVIIKVRKEWD